MILTRVQFRKELEALANKVFFGDDAAYDKVIADRLNQRKPVGALDEEKSCCDGANKKADTD